MEAPIREENNRLCEKPIRKAYFPCFLLALSFHVNSLVDSILAAALFSSRHVAAVGVSTVYLTVTDALLIIFVAGTTTAYTAALGRGQRRKSGEVFTVGLFYIAVIGLLSTLVAFFFAEGVVTLSGALEASLRTEAAAYLRSSVLASPLSAAAHLMILILGVYGHQKDAIIANFIGILSNIVSSTLLAAFVPSLGVRALGYGTMISAYLSLAFCQFSIHHHKLPLGQKMRLEGLKWSRFWDTFSSGITSGANMFIDGIVAGAINNLITASALGETGLTCYTVVFNVWTLSHVAAEGMELAAIPMLVMFSVTHDKGGVRRAFSVAAGRGMLYTLLWMGVLTLLLPFLLLLFPTELVQIIAHGSLFSLLPAPLFTVVYLYTAYLDNIGHFIRSLSASILPDSVVYPLMLLLLLPRYGYGGVWASLALFGVVSLVLCYLFRILRTRSFRVTADELLFPGLKDERTVSLDVTVGNSGDDVSRLSENIHHFLLREGASSRVAYYASLCTDELATAMRTAASSEGPLPMDCKVLALEKELLILLRMASAPFDPLAEDRSDDPTRGFGVKMAQKLAQKIDYNYVYNMNMITIQIAKD